MGIMNEVLIARINLTQDTNLAIFENIPQLGYTDLKIVTSMRSTSGQLYDYPELYINEDWENAMTSYQMKDLRVAGTSVFSGGFADWYSFNIYGSIGDAATAGIFSNTEYYLPDYTSTTRHKVITCDSVGENNAAATYMGLNVGIRKSNAAVSRLVFFPSSGLFKAGSTFSVYGIADTNASPSLAPKAEGGNIIATDGTYWYHAFLSSGYFIPQLNLTTDILVVAGGGGGGSTNGGGGGAGGLSGFSSQQLSKLAYQIVVGAGGIGGTSGGGRATNGGNSKFGSLSDSIGGGGGGGYSLSNGLSGGSGGGGAGSDSPGSGGSGTSGQGYNGKTSVGDQVGGGGGGASASANSKDGAVGSIAYSSWGLATKTGQFVSGTYYYAGGGGGGTNSGAGGDALVAGIGGLGGGASGKNQASLGQPLPGTANTGGGGGGSGGNGSSAFGGNGGSGIVIVRYSV